MAGQETLYDLTVETVRELPPEQQRAMEAIRRLSLVQKELRCKRMDELVHWLDPAKEILSQLIQRAEPELVQPQGQAGAVHFSDAPSHDS